jgi:UDP-N-acetylmuramate dehydrogenase
MLLLENIPLAPLTTFGVGGAARFFVEAKSRADVQEALAFARSRDIPMFVLGGGSNLVVSDSGWPGLVLKIGIGGIERIPGAQDGKVLFTGGAGEPWDNLVAAAVQADCAGIECLSGIPGSVGGTPVQNVGAYGQEVSETIESVEVFDLKDNQVRELCQEACGFHYRSSIFNTTERGRFIILKVAYALTPAGQPHLDYADLKRHFEGRETSPSLRELREAVRDIRTRKGMLIVDGDPDSRSAGSFFKNPVVSEDQHRDLERRATAQGLTLPSYPALESRKKISAAWLVEHSGFHRGFTLGRVGISSKHTLAMVNLGGATAVEILALKNLIQQRVDQTWGTKLEPEPVMVGF